jgi:hypothetical protein
MAPSLKTTLNQINRTLENNVRNANKVIEENIKNVSKAAKKVPWLHVVIGVIAVAIILYCIWKLLKPKKGRKESFGSTTIAGVTVPDLTSQGRPTNKGLDIRIMSENDSNKAKFKDVMEYVGDGKTSIEKIDVDEQFNKFDGDKKPFAVTIFHDGAGKAVWVRKYAVTSIDGVKPTEPLRSDPTSMEDQPNATVMYFQSQEVAALITIIEAVGFFDGIAKFLGLGAQNPSEANAADWITQVANTSTSDPNATYFSYYRDTQIGTSTIATLESDVPGTLTDALTAFKNNQDSNVLVFRGDGMYWMRKAENEDSFKGAVITDIWTTNVPGDQYITVIKKKNEGGLTFNNFDDVVNKTREGAGQSSIPGEGPGGPGGPAVAEKTPTSKTGFNIDQHAFRLKNKSTDDLYWRDWNWQFFADDNSNDPTAWSTDGGRRLINKNTSARVYVHSDIRNKTHIAVKDWSQIDPSTDFRFDKVDGTEYEYYIMYTGGGDNLAVGAVFSRFANIAPIDRSNNQFKWIVEPVMKNTTCNTWGQGRDRGKCKTWNKDFAT